MQMNLHHVVYLHICIKNNIKYSLKSSSVNIGLYEHKKSSKSIKQKMLRLAFDIPLTTLSWPFWSWNRLTKGFQVWFLYPNGSLTDAEQIRKTLLATPAKLTEETVPRLIIFWHRRELIVGSSLLFLDYRFVSACNILPHMCRFTIDGISNVNKKRFLFIINLLV